MNNRDAYGNRKYELPDLEEKVLASRYAVSINKAERRL